MTSPDGRVALITGASRGIGAAVARALTREGARLSLASRSGDDLGIDGALARPADVRDPAALRRLVAETVEQFGASTSSSSTRASGRTVRSSSSPTSISKR